MNGPVARLRPWGVLPDRYSDKQVAASTVDAHGRIVALLVEPDATCTQRATDRRTYSALAVVVDVAEVALTDLDLHFPKIDVLGDGFVMVAARCARPSGSAVSEAEIPRNARILGADGATRTGFHAGDGIGQLMTDAAGTIWTGYFDEASIHAPRVANAPAGRPGTSQSCRIAVPLPGLIRWTAAGEPGWYAVFDKAGPASWMDCNALNVGAHRTWAYPYTGFPLVDIDHDGVRCVRRTPVNFATGVIVAGDEVAFIGDGVGHPRTPGHYTVTYGRIDDGPVEAVATAPLVLPDGSRPGTWARRTVCRDNRMWMQFDDPSTWYVLEI